MMIFINKNQAIIQGADGYGHGYTNSPVGRAELAADCPPDIVTEVLALWGDTPTMPDAPPPVPEPPAPAAPTLEQRTAALEGAMLALLGGDGNV